MNDILSDGEVAVINAAEQIIKGLEQRAIAATSGATTTHDAQVLGRFAEACDNAAGTLFNIKNVANSYLRVPLTHEQLHGSTEAVTA